MGAPTYVTSAATSWSTTGGNNSTKTISLTVQVGDVIVVGGVTEQGSGSGSTLSISDNGLTSGWTLQKSLSTSSTFTATYAWTATVTTAGTLTITLTLTDSGAAAAYGGIAWQWRSSGGIGNSAIANATSGSGQVSLTTSGNNSGVCVITGDWNATTGTTTWLSVNSTVITQDAKSQNSPSGAYSVYAGHLLDAGTAGANTYGTSAPTGMEYVTIAVEVTGGSSGLTMSAAEASFGITGNAASLLVNHKLPAGTGTYSLTGESATPIVGLAISVAEASFGVTANAATLAVSGTFTLNAATASFSVSGQDALRDLGIDLGQASFGLTGNAATLSTGGGLTLAANTATFAVTGENASLLVGGLPQTGIRMLSCGKVGQ